jgi:hypothetical protein
MAGGGALCAGLALKILKSKQGPDALLSLPWEGLAGGCDEV